MLHAHLGRQAVVIGAGIGGLAAAGALSELFDRVVVLERDNLPSEATPRPGAPQGRHLHGLLAGGHQALCALFPDLEKDLARAGAIPVRVSRDFCENGPESDRPRRDLGWSAYMLSRPLIELVIRGALARLPNVTVQPQCRVTALLATPDGRRVVGARYAAPGSSEETIAADFVVDVSGRGFPTLALLQAINRPRPREMEIGVDLSYATAIFSVPRSQRFDWSVVLTHADAPHHGRRGVLCPIEHNRWMVTLVGRGAEQPPAELDGFMAYAERLAKPTIHDAIRNAKPIGDIARFGFPASVRRYFDADTIPDRLIVMGDALCRLNPAYGQGMSVAACEALLLKRVLLTRRDEREPLDGVSVLFHAQAQSVIDGPWQLAALPDFAYPCTRGQRPDDFEQTLRFSAAMRRLAFHDPAVDRLMTEVAHLLKPLSAYQDPELLRRVGAELTA
ncbi:FAD-dependent monooxygenase [Bradyrhizobium sp. Tv2a-2]|uniref:FAD-dependent monooxygenase n=1 Tax=Bradyrhizobium sp. Tv2a-2 TaxID=113395 RepID=UPI00055AEC80|nr:FAD-dependent monooxygenase [Bradyrhizobium sp. Tv2a-2]